MERRRVVIALGLHGTILETEMPSGGDAPLCSQPSADVLTMLETEDDWRDTRMILYTTHGNDSRAAESLLQNRARGRWCFPDHNRFLVARSYSNEVWAFALPESGANIATVHVDYSCSDPIILLKNEAISAVPLLTEAAAIDMLLQDGRTSIFRFSQVSLFGHFVDQLLEHGDLILHAAQNPQHSYFRSRQGPSKLLVSDSSALLIACDDSPEDWELHASATAIVAGVSPFVGRKSCEEGIKQVATLQGVLRHTFGPKPKVGGPWAAVCKHWARTGVCTNNGCPFRHVLLTAMEERRAARAQSQREEALTREKAAEDPFMETGKAAHGGRHAEFARFIIDTFGAALLTSGCGVLDIAGGRAGLSFELQCKQNVPCTLIEPREEPLKSFQRRYLRKHGLRGPRHVVARLDDEFAATAQGAALLSNCSLLVGLHCDEATEPLVRMAMRYDKPFAIVPCCVFPGLFPSRRLKSGTRVQSYDQFCDWLLELVPGSEMAFLPFEGRNRVIYCPPQIRSALGSRVGYCGLAHEEVPSQTDCIPESAPAVSLFNGAVRSSFHRRIGPPVLIARVRVALVDTCNNTCSLSGVASPQMSVALRVRFV